MGNVIALSQGAVPAPPLVLPPPAQQPASSSVADQQPAKAAEDPDNPGSFEDLHKKCKDLFPQVFEGAKLIVSKGLSSHFQISHTITMGTFQPSGYRFGGTYVGTKMYGAQEAYPVLIGDIDVSGNLNANVIHQFNKNIRSKFVAQIQNGKWLATQLATDYRGRDFTGSLTLGNVDLINESGILVGQYLQKISHNLAAGAELLYQYGQQVPGGEMAILSLAGKMTGNDWQFTTNISPGTGGLHACYYHKVAEHLEVGVEIDSSLRLQESIATVGYQLEIPTAGITFRGQLDTNWCIGAMLEKKLLPFPFTFALSGYANHTKSQYRFGIGLIVG